MLDATRKNRVFSERSDPLKLTCLKWAARLMVLLAAISIVAVTAFAIVSVLGWGLAITIGVAGAVIQGFVYTKDVTRWVEIIYYSTWSNVRNKRVLIAAVMFAFISGIAFGIVSFTDCAGVFAYILTGSVTGTLPVFVFPIITLLAISALFVNGMLICDAIVGKEGFFKDFFDLFKSACATGLTGKERAKKILKCILITLVFLMLALIFTLTILVDGGTLMEAVKSFFNMVGYIAGAAVNLFAQIMVWGFWIPAGFVFSFKYCWLSFKTVIDRVSDFIMNFFEGHTHIWADIKNLTWIDIKKNSGYIIIGIPLFICWVFNFIGEAILSGGGAGGKSDFFSNIFESFAGWLSGGVVIDPEMFAVTSAALVEGLDSFWVLVPIEGDANVIASCVSGLTNTGCFAKPAITA